jgi:xylulose-5-phosphate/fructose-6-phosphate phosphoketolase
MPGQIIAQPNPPPDPSHLSDSIREYAVQLNTSNVLTESELCAIQKFRRAANYIAAGMSAPSARKKNH